MWAKSHFPRQKLKGSDQKLDYRGAFHIQMLSLPVSAIFGSTAADHLGKHYVVLKSGFLSCRFNHPPFL